MVIQVVGAPEPTAPVRGRIVRRAQQVVHQAIAGSGAQLVFEGLELFPKDVLAVVFRADGGESAVGALHELRVIVCDDQPERRRGHAEAAAQRERCDQHGELVDPWRSRRSGFESDLRQDFAHLRHVGTHSDGELCPLRVAGRGSDAAGP